MTGKQKILQILRDNDFLLQERGLKVILISKKEIFFNDYEERDNCIVLKECAGRSTVKQALVDYDDIKIIDSTAGKIYP